MKVKIAVCNRRTDKKYKNQEMDWQYISDRNKNPVRTSETAEEYPKLPKEQRANLKDIGGLVGGWLKGGIRKNGNVLFRTVGLLDADHVPAEFDFCGAVRKVFGDITYFIYSTHSHTPDNPRYRLVILLSREVSEDEYPALMRMFKHIYETVKAYDSTKEMNICLPGMTSVNGSVGGENWCVYGDLDKYCDTASIMSYGMAWAGSAPGPVSPRSWLEGIYDYATKVMNPDKVFLGMPAYGWNWQIYDTPENLGKYYRGTSHTYYAAKYWMQGVYNFTDDAPPQPFIPIVSYWDDYDMRIAGLFVFLAQTQPYCRAHDKRHQSNSQNRFEFHRRNLLFRAV